MRGRKLDEERNKDVFSTLLVLCWAWGPVILFTLLTILVGVQNLYFQHIILKEAQQLTIVNNGASRP